MRPISVASPLVVPRGTAGCDAAVEGLIATLLVVTPCSFAPFDAAGELLALGLVAAAAACMLASAWRRADVRIVRTWAYLPIAVLLLLVAVQLMPLPVPLRENLLPGATRLRTEAATLAGLDASGWAPASLYPLATWRQLRLLGGGAVLFVVVLHAYVGQPSRVRRLLRMITMAGLAMACLGVGQFACDAGTILGLAARGDRASGTFANHGHFGQFINLSIGAAAALLIEAVQRLRRGGHTWSGVREALLRDRRHWDVWMALALLSFGPIACLTAMTRGGVASLVVGLLAAALAMASLSSRGASALRDAPVFVVLGALMIALVIIGLTFGAGYERLASLIELRHSSGGRLELLRDTLSVCRCSPWIGTGLGTHAFVFPAFDRSDLGRWASHGENEYVQWLEEAGVIGLSAVLAFLAVIYGTIVRGLLVGRHQRDGAGSGAMLAGLSIGLVAATVQSATDFGQHMPAIAFLTAMECALVLIVARDQQDRPRGGPLLTRSRLVIATTALATAVIVFTPSLLRDRRAADAFWAATEARQRLDTNGWSIESPDYRELLVQAKAAHEAQPLDVEYTFWLNAWRWEAIAQQMDPAATRLDPQLAGWARQVIDDLLASTQHCPTFGRPLVLAGRLEMQLPELTSVETERARAQVERGATLASYDAQASFLAGRTAAASGEREGATKFLDRALAMGWPRAEVVETYATLVGDLDAARARAADDLPALDRLIDILRERQPVAAAALETERATLIEKRAGDVHATPATLDDLANRFLQAGDRRPAIDCLKRATTIDYANADRRLRLADLLAEAGDFDEAIAQADVARQFRPGDDTIDERIKRWRSHARP